MAALSAKADVTQGSSPSFTNCLICLSCHVLPSARPGPPCPQPSKNSRLQRISATYADRFDSYSGQRMEVIAQQPSSSGIIIKTRIVKSNGEPVSVDYAMRQNDGAWQISDIYLDGTISQLATQRSEFGAILRREGFDGLIVALQRKVKLLAGSVPHAS